MPNQTDCRQTEQTESHPAEPGGWVTPEALAAKLAAIRAMEQEILLLKMELAGVQAEVAALEAEHPDL